MSFYGKASATTYLESWLQTSLISEIYDEDDKAQECILLLCPDFEYPEWSHRTIREFLKEFGHKRS